jgi:hypothetical protein
MRDALRVEPVDQALYLRHHFGADAVAGEKQQFVGRHDRFLIQLVMAGLVPAIHVLFATKKDVDARQPLTSLRSLRKADCYGRA